MFTLSTMPELTPIHNLLLSSFDHLIIDRRCRELGFGAEHTGAASFESLLTLNVPPGENQATFCVLMLGQLIKFRFYLCNPAAEAAILNKFPFVRSYWSPVAESIEAIPLRAEPTNVWNVVRLFSAVADRAFSDYGTKIRFSDFFGFNPYPITRSALGRLARDFFTQSAHPGDDTLILVHTVKDHILVGALKYPSRETVRILDDAQDTSDFAVMADIILLVRE